jgi:uncharacterized protein (TIGR00369 family)
MNDRRQSHSSPDFLDVINRLPDGWVKANGLRFVGATPEAVTAEMVVGPQHLQPYGLVHGGVYAGIVESLASVGAAIDVMPHGRSAVGLENHTTFVRACREGTLHARATPVTRGLRTQVWEVTITDDAQRLIATGRVRLLVLDTDSAVAGGDLAIKGE